MPSDPKRFKFIGKPFLPNFSQESLRVRGLNSFLVELNRLYPRKGFLSRLFLGAKWV
jgi:hypothetical protein